ncbi:hypothetical protein J0910_09250 [Nocardiopsis sp. CNT-189]|uniref:hypothetical protein n=1 Tax=Nocardiopsis oceanisediminis TaxID=2816862 RepID=UPI003B33BC61
MARTLTSAIRLLDALTVAFRGDQHRLQVLFTFDGGSAFSTRTLDMLKELGGAVVPWDEAPLVPASLTVTASENVDLERLSAPVVVLPHGIGFQKWVPDSESGDRRLSGVVRKEFADRPGIVTVVSHPAQREQLRDVHTGLADAAEVTGDHVHDRIRAGLRHRARYRAHLGVPPRTRLAVLSSTWGGQGLLGSRPGLPERLLAELPYDEYRVAAVLHPNIGTAHGPWAVRQALARAVDAGLLVLPPEEGWEAALAAADVVLGDHGSVTLYAAAADRPVLLGAFGEESVPGTAAALLAASADRLDPEADLRRQLDAAVDGHVPGRHTDAAGHAFAHPGEGAERLRGLLYRLIGLSPPPGPQGPLRTSPPPEPETRPVTSFEVVTRVCEDGRAVAAERFPAAVRRPADTPGAVRHLAAWDTEPDVALARSASVVLRSPAPAADDRTGAEWAADALAHHPGALFASAPEDGGCTAHLRDGRTVAVRVLPGGLRPPDLCPLSALVYTLLRAGSPVQGEYRLRVGSDQWRCKVRESPPAR